MAKRYSEVEIEKGLIAAATLGIRPAGEKLGIPHETIFNWTQRYPERYAAIKVEEAPKWRERAAAATEETIDTLTLAEAKLAQRLLDETDQLDTKDLPSALKNAGLAKAVNVDKAEKLRDRPTEVRELRVNVEQVGKLLARYDVDTTAEEIEPSSPSVLAEG